MMSPSSFAVFALKFLQKSHDVWVVEIRWVSQAARVPPTGAPGWLFPPAIWSFTIACIFFACSLSGTRRSRSAFSVVRAPSAERPEHGSLYSFLYLQKIQFDRPSRGRTKIVTITFSVFAVEVYLVHDAG